MIDQHINSRLIARDVAERLGIWGPAGWRLVKNAIDRHGADLVWRLVDDAIQLERTATDAPRRAIFFDLLKQYRWEVL